MTFHLEGYVTVVFETWHRLLLLFLIEMGSFYVVQAGLTVLGSVMLTSLPPKYPGRQAYATVPGWGHQVKRVTLVHRPH